MADEYPFGDYEEEAILSLMLDYPEFFQSISKFMTYELFQRPEVQYVVGSVTKYHDEYGVFPTREIITDIIKKNLTVDNIGYEDIVEILKRQSDPREVPHIKDRLIEWARSRAYGLIFDPETIDRYNKGDFEYLEELVEKARNIQDVSSGALWFFRDIEKIFEEDHSESFTTGFNQLDRYIHENGPKRKEVVVWMAPTGRGKSIMLVNNAMYNMLKGRNVLYITLELSDVMSAARGLCSITNKPINNRKQLKSEMLKTVKSIKSSNNIGDVVFKEFPPDEVSVDEIDAFIDILKRSERWMPDIIIIDYLELMVSRRQSDNKEDYRRQKSVSTQVRGLATKHDVLIFTATQTNRSGNDSENIDITKIAESYGKSMPMDYLISINQDEDEYNDQFDAAGNSVRPVASRAYIAKNRNGPKFQSVELTINYKTMSVKEKTQ